MDRLWIRLSLLLLMPASVLAHDPRCRPDCDTDGAVDPIDLQILIADVFTSSTGCVGISAERAVASDIVAAVRAIVDSSLGCSTTPTPVGSAQPTPTATATMSAVRSRWIALAPLALGPRQEVGVALLDDEIYVVGGFEGPIPAESSRVEVYDIPTNQWHTVEELPEAGHHIGAGSDGQFVYALGGLESLSFVPRATVYRYDAVADHWDTVAPMPTARGALAVAELDGRLYAIGGSGSGGSVTDHAVYDPALDRWTPLAPLPTARNHIAAAAVDGTIYVVGGRGGPNTAELDAYDVTTNQWHVLAPMPTARSGHAAAVISGRVVVMGGEVNDANPPTRVFPQVEIYDPTTNRWSAIEPMAVPRHGIGAVTYNGLIYVPGGAARAGFGASARNDALEILSLP